MIFTGTFDLQIDNKNRLAIPSEVRTLVQKYDDEHNEKPVFLYVCFGDDNSSLCLYTKEGFEKRAAELDNSSRPAEEVLEYERMMYSLSKYVEVDKTGRILVPKDLVELAGLTSEVVMLGAKDHLEIRDRAAWYEYRKAKLAEKKMKNPREMTASPTEQQLVGAGK